MSKANFRKDMIHCDESEENYFISIIISFIGFIFTGCTTDFEKYIINHSSNEQTAARNIIRFQNKWNDIKNDVVDLLTTGSQLQYLKDNYIETGLINQEFIYKVCLRLVKEEINIK